MCIEGVFTRCLRREDGGLGSGGLSASSCYPLGGGWCLYYQFGGYDG